jgi:hypothetical protein
MPARQTEEAPGHSEGRAVSAAPNLAAARTFLQRFDPEAEIFTFQSFDDTDADRRELAKVVQVDPAGDVLETFAGLNVKQRAGIFFTVNETDGWGRNAKNIVRVRAVFVDLDGAPLAPVLDAGLEPHFVVESSSGRWHVYWLVDDCPLDQFERVQLALARRFNGDRNVHDLPRVLRVPGYLHQKERNEAKGHSGEPFESRVLDGVGFNGPPYALAEIVASLKLELDTQDTGTDASTNGGNSETDDELRGHIINGDKGQVYFALRGLAARFVGRGMDTRDAIAALQGLLDAAAWRVLDPKTWTKRREGVVTLVESAARKYADPRTKAAATPDDFADITGASTTDRPPWPAAMDVAALHGIAGEFVRMVEPNTEADPAAITLQFLAAFGVYIGRGPHYRVEGDEHHANINVLLVGATSKGRKGTSWGRVRATFERLDDWKPDVSGLASGEGIKYHVRDPVEKMEKDKQGEFVTVIVDMGVSDKRLFVVEPEFASVLRIVQRQGSTLSASIRQAWDTGNLRTLTKHDPITVTGAHIAIVGHITDDELRAELTATDIANGLANRFLFVAVRRSKLLPFGGDRDDEDKVQALVMRLRERAELARIRQQIGMTEAAKAAWAKVYPELSAGSEGMHGAVTARAEAQVIRLSLIYCLLDGAAAIDLPHLQAGLAVWRYCDATAKHVFGASLGDRTADEILRRLEKAGDSGMTRTEIRDVFGRNLSTERIGAALDLLLNKRRVTCKTVKTNGRPSEVWKARR